MNERATAEEFEPSAIVMSHKAEVLDTVEEFTDPRLDDYQKDVYGDSIEFALLVEPELFRAYRAEKHDWDLTHQSEKDD